jgi:hypothetical protein
MNCLPKLALNHDPPDLRSENLQPLTVFEMEHEYLIHNFDYFLWPQGGSVKGFIKGHKILKFCHMTELFTLDLYFSRT